MQEPSTTCLNRRQLLASVATTSGVILTGCSGLQSGDSTTPAPESGEPTPTGTNPFRFHAAVTTATPSSDSPPKVQVEVKNTDSQAHTLTIADSSFPFATPQATSSGQSLVLAEEILTGRENGCWQGSAEVLSEPSGRSFDPDESFSRTYSVVNPPDAAECWPTGSFEFTEMYYLDPETKDSTDSGTQFTWGFTVTVAEGGTITLTE